jgi:putative phosphoribosyl transferase
MFEDRREAGHILARKLQAVHEVNSTDAVVLGLPRGGVPVAAEVADVLDAPLDVIVVRKLGMPGQPEFAMGAIGENDVLVLDEETITRDAVTPAELATVEQRERAQLDARVARLRRDRPRVDLSGRTAVIVDDGIATGATARAACQVARLLGAEWVVLAAPVAPASTVPLLVEADQAVIVEVAHRFVAVSVFYRDFSPTSDDDVAAILAARPPRGP